MQKAGWTITHDPFPLQIGNKRLSADLGAERIISAEKGAEKIVVEALFDTGFTDGWLAINRQDLDALGWSLITSQVELATAGGEAQFDIYQKIGLKTPSF